PCRCRSGGPRTAARACGAGPPCSPWPPSAHLDPAHGPQDRDRGGEQQWEQEQRHRAPLGNGGAVPVPTAARRRDRDPAGRARDRGALMVATVNTAALRRKHERQYVARRIGIYTAAIIAALLCAGPFVWSAITAFKQNRDLYNPDSNPFVFNRPPTPDHVTYLFTGTGFLTFAWNTLWVGLLVVLITL